MDGVYQRFPKCEAPGGALLVLWGGGERVVCMRDIFIFNKIWAQDKINILVGTSLD
jgi:hypothetical protein